MNIAEDQLPGDISRIRLEGRFDIDGQHAIERGLTGMTAAPRMRIIVDLAGVRFLASIGIRSLLVAARSVAGRGGKLVLLDPEPSVARVLESAGVDMLIPVVRGLDAAISEVARA